MISISLKVTCILHCHLLMDGRLTHVIGGLHNHHYRFCTMEVLKQFLVWIIDCKILNRRMLQIISKDNLLYQGPKLHMVTMAWRVKLFYQDMLQLKTCHFSRKRQQRYLSHHMHQAQATLHLLVNKKFLLGIALQVKKYMKQQNHSFLAQTRLLMVMMYHKTQGILKDHLHLH